MQPLGPASRSTGGGPPDDGLPPCGPMLTISLPAARLGTMLLLVPVGLMLVSLAYRAWAASGGGAVLPPERFFDSVGSGARGPTGRHRRPSSCRRQCRAERRVRLHA